VACYNVDICRKIVSIARPRRANSGAEPRLATTFQVCHKRPHPPIPSSIVATHVARDAVALNEAV